MRTLSENNAATSTTALNLEEDKQDLLSKLELLMKRHDTRAWAGMLRYLQWELNTTYRNGKIFILSV